MSNIRYRSAAIQKAVILALVIGAAMSFINAQSKERPSETFVRLERDGCVPPFKEPTPIPVRKVDRLKKPTISLP